jgi:mannose-6-phosphate isomerase-like protein (cupin superfamily)
MIGKPTCSSALVYLQEFTMPVVRATETPTFDLPGVRFSAYAAPSRGSNELCTWRITVAPGHDAEPHTLDRDETFLVLSGRLRCTPDGPELGAGDVAIVPAGEPIAVVNPGPDEAVAYIAIAAGFTATTAEGERLQPPWAL